jgi:hypothetical protein
MVIVGKIINTKRYVEMPRTSTDLRKKRSYNILIYEDDFDVIYKMAVDRTRKGGSHVSAAQIVREAIHKFLEEGEGRAYKYQAKRMG